MRTLTDFALRLEYERIKYLGDKLVDIGGRLNWESFRPALEAMYKNNTECGGRPNLDVIVMFKSLFIQQLYNLSDEQLEREIADRISFRVFLGTTETVPDSTTIWKFRERLVENGVDREIWAEMQRQLDAMNLKVQKGVMQDATFITADPGHAKADTPRGIEFSDTSCMIAQMKNFVWLEESRLQLPMSMIVKWIWPKKAKFDMLIKDMMEPRQKDIMQP